MEVINFQDQKPENEIELEKVTVEDLKKYIIIKRPKETYHIIVTINSYLTLPSNLRRAYMSRFVEYVEETPTESTSIEDLVQEISERTFKKYGFNYFTEVFGELHFKRISRGEEKENSIAQMFSRYLCNAKYALENVKDMSVEAMIQENSKYPCKSISITGSEPILQKEELLDLVKRLKELGYWIQINTNGIIIDEEIFKLVDLISMDFKCPSSGIKSDLKVLERANKLFGFKTQFKFIIFDERDYNYARKVLPLLNSPNIVFQPGWGNRKFTKKLKVNLVKIHGLNVRVIIQQHKVIWGNKRGV